MVEYVFPRKLKANLGMSGKLCEIKIDYVFLCFNLLACSVIFVLMIPLKLQVFSGKLCFPGTLYIPCTLLFPQYTW